MDDTLQQKILTLLDSHRIMTIATLRPDGWPQATTVGYVNEGLTLWFLCGLESQKAGNLAHDDRVSITIDHDTRRHDVDHRLVDGGARPSRERPRRGAEGDRDAAAEVSGRAAVDGRQMKMPAPEDVALFRVVPEIVSVLDYTKGFAHTDLVTC